MFEADIQNKLKEMHNSGMTYEEIAEATGIAKTVVGVYTSGARPIKNPTISLLMKVFPKCKIFLDGVIPGFTRTQDQSVVIGDGAIAAVGIAEGDVSVNTGGSVRSSGIPADIRDAIISDKSLSAKEKVEMLKALMQK